MPADEDEEVKGGEDDDEEEEADRDGDDDGVVLLVGADFVVAVSSTDVKVGVDAVCAGSVAGIAVTDIDAEAEADELEEEGADTNESGTGPLKC